MFILHSKQFSELLMYILQVDSVQMYLFYVLHSGQCSELFNVHLTQ